MKHTHNLFFAEKRLAYNLGNSPKLSSSAEKVPSSVCKKADARYFSVIKKVGKLSAASFQKKFEKSTLPAKAKKAAIEEVNKTKFLYPTQEAFDAQVTKVSKKLIKLIIKDSKIKSSDLPNLIDEAQDGIKVAAQDAAGFQSSGSSNINTNTTRNAQFKNIVSNMNGKVSKTQLLQVVKNYKKIATTGINIAINRKINIPRKIKKHMTTALNA